MQDQNIEITPEQKPRRASGYEVRKKLLPSLLLALAAPLTVFVFGPIDIFINNADECRFAISDFIGYNALFALALASLIFAVLLLLRGKAFDIVASFVFSCSLMLFVQGNYLNFNINSLAGDGLGDDPLTPLQITVNAIIWAVVIIGCAVCAIMLKKKHHEIIKTVAMIAMVTVIGMQLVSCTVSLAVGSATSTEESSATETESESASESKTESSSQTESETESSDATESGSETNSSSAGGSVTEDVTDEATTNEATTNEATTNEATTVAIPSEIVEPDGEYVLTYKNFNVVSSEKNIIVFVIDRFDYEYYKRALKTNPEIFAELEGFTYFDNAISLYPRTFPSITYMVTGVEQDFSMSREDYFKTAYATSPFLYTLKNNNYNVNIYTDTYYGYENAGYMHGYVSNSSGSSEYTVNDPLMLSVDMTRLSLYRYLPLGAKRAVGNISTPDINKHITFSSDFPEYSTDMKDAYTYLSDNPLTLVEGKNNYSFIHLAGCHLPNKYDENFNEASESDARSTLSSLKQSFKIINLYISQLKALGVYEDATIIITGDHCSIGSDSEVPLRYEHVTSLFVKPSGVKDGAIVNSNAPVSHVDLFATMLKSAGINSDAFGTSVFDVSEDDDRERKYYFQSYQKVDGKTNYEFVEFKVVGDAKNYSENWEIVRRYYIGGSIYD